MPIYEYECDRCQDRFEKLVRSDCCVEVVCPSCGSDEVHKVMSLFGVRAGGPSKGPYQPAGNSCGST